MEWWWLGMSFALLKILTRYDSFFFLCFFKERYAGHNYSHEFFDVVMNHMPLKGIRRHANDEWVRCVLHIYEWNPRWNRWHDKAKEMLKEIGGNDYIHVIIITVVEPYGSHLCWKYNCGCATIMLMQKSILTAELNLIKQKISSVSVVFVNLLSFFGVGGDSFLSLFLFVCLIAPRVWFDGKYFQEKKCSVGYTNLAHSFVKQQLWTIKGKRIQFMKRKSYESWNFPSCTIVHRLNQYVWVRRCRRGWKLLLLWLRL